MNDQLIERGRQAFRAGDFATAAQMFQAGKDPSEVDGEVDHLLGNSLMRTGRYAEADKAYESALADTSYGKRGALLTNQGKARYAMGDYEGASKSFNAATHDASYSTPYKAYMGLGQSLEKLGDMTQAGVAFREAALDGTNPAPAAALTSLGDCFVALDRPEDAIESYRSALDFAGPRDDVRAINASLGEAAVAANRLTEASDAFGKATSDGIYQLTPSQQVAYDRAQDMLSSAGSATTAQAAAVGNGYSSGIDPLDPLGKSGEFMPDPSDTGFFTLTESEMIQQDKRESKVRRKRRHTGLKVFLVIVIILLLAAVGLAYAYTQGYGYPTQQQTLTSLFEAASNGEDCSEYLSSSLSESSQEVIVSTIPEGSEPTIEGLDRSMTESTATVSVELSLGGTVTYEVDFVREGLGWVVSDLTIDAGDLESSDTSTETDETTESTETDGSETTDETDSTDSADAADTEESTEE